MGENIMSQVLENMMSRRSIRSYKSTPVPRELLDQIIEAGRWAASGKNRQACKIICITDKAVRDKISEMNCRIGGWSDTMDPFYGAPCIIIVLAEKEWRNRVYDGTLILGNMMLAAHDAGLGSCWIHRAKEEFESPEGKEILQRLGIEGEWEGIGHLAVGYIEGEYPKAPRRKGNEVYYL